MAAAGRKPPEGEVVEDTDTAGAEEVEAGAVDPSAARNVGGGNWDWGAFGWWCSFGHMKKKVEEELTTNHQQQQRQHHHHYIHPNPDCTELAGAVDVGVVVVAVVAEWGFDSEGAQMKFVEGRACKTPWPISKPKRP